MSRWIAVAVSLAVVGEFEWDAMCKRGEHVIDERDVVHSALCSVSVNGAPSSGGSI